MNTAVSAVLGRDLDERIRRSEGLRPGELDVEVLLRGVEKLSSVVSVPGVGGRVRGARERYGRVRARLEGLEERVVEQGLEVERMNRGEGGREERWGETEEDGQEEDGEDVDELILREEREIRELEERKRELEERVAGMERDLGGLMR